MNIKQNTDNQDLNLDYLNRKFNVDLESIEDKARRIGVPIIPKLPERPEKKPIDNNPVVAICGECGRNCHVIEWYYCSKQNCPIQVKPML